MLSQLRTYFANRALESKLSLSLRRVTSDSPLTQKQKIIEFRNALDAYHDHIDPHLKNAPPCDTVQRPIEKEAVDYFKEKTPNDWYWLINLDGTDIGYLYIEVYKTDFPLKEGILSHVWIEPQWQGQGILSFALKEAISILKKKYRLKTVFVNYLLSNTNAQRAYQKIGFKPWSETLILEV